MIKDESATDYDKAKSCWSSLGYGGARRGLAAAAILMLLLAPLLAVQPASAAQPPTLTVSTSTQTLLADQENLVEVTVTNTGEFKAISAFMTVGLPSPGSSGALMILNGSDGRYYLGDLAPGQNITIPLKVVVGRGAAGGLYQITFSFTYQFTGTVTDTRAVGFSVPSLDTYMAKLDLSLTPQHLVAGANNSLSLSLRNVGNGTAESLAVSLTLPGSQGASSAYILMGSDGTWYLDRLGPGEEAVIPFQVYVLSSASNTGATFTFTTSFSDQQSRSKQQSNAFGVIAMGNVNIVILSSSTYPSKVRAGQPFSLTVTLLNIGSTTAQSMIFTPNGLPQMTPLSQSKVYLGDLGVNVPSSLTLPFVAGNVTAGNYTLPIEYTYRNSLGMNLSGTLQIPFRIVLDETNNNSTNPAAPSPSPFALLLFAVPFVLVIAVAAYLLHRRKSGSGR